MLHEVGTPHEEKDMIDTATTCPIVGLREVADLLGVQPRTPHIWKYRDLLPAADYDNINCSVAWDRATILRWASDVGRLPSELKAEAEDALAAKKTKKVQGAIVGLREIADLLNVKPRTPHIWKYRDLMPEADYDSINCSAAWDRSTIILWAESAGRLPEELQAEARKAAKSRAKKAAPKIKD